MSNTITAYFKGRVGVAESVYQNDYGIVMAFDSIDLPAHFDCYFSRLNQEEALPGLGADNRVTIPNSILANPGNVTIHIPLHTGEDDSEVEYVIYFKVIGRARPIDDGTPAQMTAIERALALLSQPITNIEEIVNEALSFTGDTFAEMKQELADDFAEYKGDVDDDIADFKTEIRGDIADVEHDFDILDGQFQTAVAAITVDSEVQGIRTGDDGITYTTAGEAVRKQFANVKNSINDLNDCFIISPNIFDITKITDGKYMTDSGDVGTNASYCYTDYMRVSEGDVLWFSTLLARWYVFYDSAKQRISGGENGTRGHITAPTNAAYVIMTFLSPNYTGADEAYKVKADTMVNVGTTMLDYVPFGIISLNKNKLPDMYAELAEIFMEIDKYCDSSPNLIDYSSIIHGKYMSQNGSVGSGASYCYTNLIPVSPTDKLYWSESEARVVTCFNENKEAVTASGVENQSSPFTIPSGIHYVVLSLYDANVDSSIMCNVGSRLLPFVPYGGIIKQDRLPHISPEPTGELGQVANLLGHNSLIAQQSSLSANSAITIDSSKQPLNMRKNIGVTFECNFNEFGTLTVGMGESSYLGKWIKIYTDKIEVYKYNATAQLIDTISMSLTITDYIKVALYAEDNGDLFISINSRGGTFTTKSSENLYEIHGVAFAHCAVAVTNAKLTYTCGDTNKPMWMFGDSYFGNSADRVMGQLDNLGFFRNVCVNSLGGAGVDTAQSELNKMLQFGTPKFIVWCLGMNGSDSNSIAKLEWLEGVCADNNIELIAYKVPSIPEALHTDYNQAVVNSGLRYVDAYSAVGADGQGDWYSNYLSYDNTHPTELGAKAIAMQFLIDCPEIMQYGKDNN